MSKKVNAFVMILSFVALQVNIGCSTSRALVDYKSISDESKVTVHEGSVNGTSLGKVKGDEGGEIWSNCTEKAEDSMKIMLLEAKEKGANAIGDIKWYASGTSQPACKKGWGYLVIWPFILTPLFMSTEVEATMYKVDGKKNAAGLIMIPENPAEEQKLIKKLVSGTTY